ncbi:cupredoxin domain-containing protein [Euzebya tangerina]|uniref:cupredoxin domain-containing protein n=1 Tax=Euzebya tangerina TaxID=591198 RepID=UPI000E31275B|nr:cupredoxin domain-containing protein [Euzebya tangerina]
MRLVPVVLLVLVLAACSSTPPPTANVATGPAADADVQIIMIDDAFSPEQTEVEGNGPVTVDVRNDGEDAHNLVSADGTVVTPLLEPGDVVSFSVPIDGEWRFRCTLHGGMEGTISR